MVAMRRIIIKRKCALTNSVVVFKNIVFNLLFLLGCYLLKFSMRQDIEISETKKKGKINSMTKYHVANLR